MKIREIWRQELALRGIRLRDMIEAEQLAEQRCLIGAAVMDSECPPKMEPLLHKLLGDLADEVCAPNRERQ